MSTWHNEYRVWLTEEQSLENGQIVANFFSDSDWTNASLSAMLGNMRHESSINPDMYEYGYDWAEDRGYGLVQWTPRSKYWDWAEANLLEPRAGESQLMRIQYEIDNDIQWIAIADFDYMTFTEFRQNTAGLTVAQLTEAFVRCYERPADWTASIAERTAFAELASNTLVFGSGVPSIPDIPTFKNVPLHLLQEHRNVIRRQQHRGRR